VIDLKYSLVIEATEDPDFFGFYSLDIEGFAGIGQCLGLMIEGANEAAMRSRSEWLMMSSTDSARVGSSSSETCCPEPV